MSVIKVRWMVDDDFSSMPPRGSYRVFMRNGGKTKIYPGAKGTYTAEQAVWALRKIYETRTKDRVAQYIEKV